MIFNRKIRKINITINKLCEEIDLLNELIRWEANDQLNGISSRRFGESLQEMQTKKANFEKNLHINRK
jgi:hypothetical protein